MKNLQYNFMTTKNIKPSGWLLKQLKIQAKGLCGNLDKVWPDIKDSAWIGGDREGWERVPYWLDGFVPLAYLLEDDDMIRRARFYIDAIIKRQNEDGWICPCGREERANYDTWATLLILKVLTVYADCSGDERILELVEKCLRQFDVHINFNTLRTWGAARWGLFRYFGSMRGRMTSGLSRLQKSCAYRDLTGRDFLKPGLLMNLQRTNATICFRIL